MSPWESFLWALVGAVLSSGIATIPVVRKMIQYRRRPDLLGEWHSSYEGIDKPPSAWVTDTVAIKSHSKKLILTNESSSEGYMYSARAAIVQKNHLVGDWESIRPGANAYGTFILTVSAQGDAMYGYWVGPDQAGARRYGRWVLARDKNNISAAKALLDKMRQSRLADQNPTLPTN